MHIFEFYYLTEIIAFLLSSEIARTVLTMPDEDLILIVCL